VDLQLRPLTRDDLPRLGRWIAAPHVAPWWREPSDPASVESRYGPPLDGTEPTELFVVVVDDRPIGFAQRYRIDDNPEWERALEPAAVPRPAAGIDYLIGEEGLLGRGLGPRLIEQLVGGLWARHPDVVAAVADVDPANRRSWRALEKCGFERWWSGAIESEDPGDGGPALVYVCRRP
jgi:aminoglycoside 6'-N-acetyltransferase